MPDWYYVESNRQHGPLAAEALASLLRSGRIGRDTRIWREGLPEWRPLHEFASELGLDGISASGPPPIPSHAASTRPAVAAPAKKTGLSGGMITLIVIAAAAIPAIAIIAILAAIAIPAYQDYVLRAKVAEASLVGVQFKSLVAEHRAQTGYCPDNGDLGDAADSGYSSAYVASVVLGEFDDGHCGIELHLDTTGSNAVDGHRIWFDYDPETHEWACGSEIADRHLPGHCRG